MPTPLPTLIAECMWPLYRHLLFAVAPVVSDICKGSALTAENLTEVVKATGNDVPAYYPTLFATYLEKSEGCAVFCKMSAGGKCGRCAFVSVRACGASPGLAIPCWHLEGYFYLQVLERRDTSFIDEYRFEPFFVVVVSFVTGI